MFRSISRTFEIQAQHSDSGEQSQVTQEGSKIMENISIMNWDLIVPPYQQKRENENTARNINTEDDLLSLAVNGEMGDYLYAGDGDFRTPSQVFNDMDCLHCPQYLRAESHIDIVEAELNGIKCMDGALEDEKLLFDEKPPLDCALSIHDFSNVEANMKMPNLNIEGRLIQYEILYDALYDKEKNKIYTKPKEPCFVRIKYSQTAEDRQTYALCMAVYKTDLMTPVNRCANHQSADKDEDESKRCHVLRCKNKDSIYLGTENGTNVNERLSVLVPSNNYKANDNCTLEIGLEFVCQNFCMGRRELCLAIYLMNSKFEILGNAVIDVKVCCCPKRDMKNELRPNVNGKKRRRDANVVEDDAPPGKKVMNIEMHQGTESSSKNGVRLTMDLPNIESARHVIECTFNSIAAQIISNPTSSSLPIWKQYLAQLQEQKNKLSAPI